MSEKTKTILLIIVIALLIVGCVGLIFGLANGISSNIGSDAPIIDNISTSTSTVIESIGDSVEQIVVSDTNITF